MRSSRARLLAATVLVGIIGALAPAASSLAAPAGRKTSGDPVVADPAPTGTGSTSAPATSVVVRARLVVQSSGADAIVRMVPGGASLIERVISGPGSATMLADGVQVRSGGATTTATLDLFWRTDPSAAPVLRVEKSSVGTVTATLSLFDGTPLVAVTNSSGNTKRKVVEALVPSSALRTAAMSLPRADDRSLVLAAYYPWFGMTSYGDPTLSDRPLEPRNTTGPLGVDSMLDQAAANGVDGFVSSYAGKPSDIAAAKELLASASSNDSLVSLYLEVPAILRDAVDKRLAMETVLAAARPLLDDPRALRAPDGVPVVFAFAMASLSAADWQSVLEATGPLHIIGDADTSTHGKVLWGVHQYYPYAPGTPAPSASSFPAGVNNRAWAEVLGARPRLTVGTVWPGFDDRELRGDDRPVVERRGTAEYADNWARVTSDDVDWVLITSWNEWFEGTSIEPSVETGTSALDVTGILAERFRRQR